MTVVKHFLLPLSAHFPSIQQMECELGSLTVSFVLGRGFNPHRSYADTCNCTVWTCPAKLVLLYGSLIWFLSICTCSYSVNICMWLFIHLSLFVIQFVSLPSILLVPSMVFVLCLFVYFRMSFLYFIYQVFEVNGEFHCLSPSFSACLVVRR